MHSMEETWLQKDLHGLRFSILDPSLLNQLIIASFSRHDILFASILTMYSSSS